MTEECQIASAIELVTDIIERGEGLLVIAITPVGPRVFGPLPEAETLYAMRMIIDELEARHLPDPPSDFLAAIGKLQ